MSTTTKSKPSVKSSTVTAQNKSSKAPRVKVAKAPVAKSVATKADPTPRAPSVAASRNTSRDVFNGKRMRIMEYQDYTFTIQAKRQLTDEQLAADWRAQFPRAVAFTAFHVLGARRDFNAGRHSKAYRNKPATPVPSYGADKTAAA